MATRKPWDSLSPEYRERLSRQGITPQSHAAGESIRAARGHQNTPEHPTQGIRDAARFPDWFATRNMLVQRVIQRKRELFGDDFKFSTRRAAKYVNEGADGRHPPSMAMLRWALDASEDEILERLSSHDEDYSFLFYH